MESEEYLVELERRCGKSADFLYDAMADGGSGIGIMGFDNYPAVGEFTYFSYGLHRLEKPEWKYGAPEYFVVIDCPDRRIAAYFGHLLSVFGFEKPMTWNTLIGIGESDAIDGYPYRWLALAPPAYLHWDNYKISPRDGLSIHLGSGYFISNNDFNTVRDRGMYYLKEKMEEDYEYWKRIQRT